MAQESTRSEHDLLGEVAVPADARYGAQTQRAVMNFPLNGQRCIGDFPTLVRGLLRVKQAGATANLKAGLLRKEIAEAIVRSAEGLLAETDYRETFPIHFLHGGGGTSANMNANEVLANLAEERLGGRRGEYRRVHPNDHVNLNQSTNDVIPTACHIAVIEAWPTLKGALEELADELAQKSEELGPQERIARTCLQDAVATTFGDLWGGYAGFVNRSVRQIGRAVEELHAVNLGGTIVGRSDDVPAGYFEGIIAALRGATGDERYHRSEDLYDAAQNLDDLVRVSSELDLAARGLVKIGQDLRLMNSGPETGLGEIALPAMQPGSSIMPGKVNPVMPEHAMQLCFRAMGLHASAQATLDHGELDLNVWESTAVFAVLESMELLSSAAGALGAKCIRGLRVDAERNQRNAQSLIARVTELAKQHGYSRVNAVCKQARGDLTKLRELLSEAFPEG